MTQPESPASAQSIADKVRAAAAAVSAQEATEERSAIPHGKDPVSHEFSETPLAKAPVSDEASAYPPKHLTTQREPERITDVPEPDLSSMPPAERTTSDERMPLYKRKGVAIPTAVGGVAAIAAGAFFLSRGSEHSPEATSLRHSASSSTTPIARETSPGVSGENPLAANMAQDLKTSIMEAYNAATTTHTQAPLQTQQSTSPASALDKYGATTFLVGNNNAPSTIPGYTGWYSASLTVENAPNGTPNFSQIDSVAIASTAYTPAENKTNSSQTKQQLFSLNIVKQDGNFAVTATGIGPNRSPWAITDTGAANLVNETPLTSLSDYSSVEDAATYVMNALVDNQPVQYVTNPAS